MLNSKMIMFLKEHPNCVTADFFTYQNCNTLLLENRVSGGLPVYKRMSWSGLPLLRGLSTLKGGNSRVYPYPSKGKGRVGF